MNSLRPARVSSSSPELPRRGNDAGGAGAVGREAGDPTPA
jgi:hypothetical protein